MEDYGEDSREDEEDSSGAWRSIDSKLVRLRVRERKHSLKNPCADLTCMAAAATDWPKRIRDLQFLDHEGDPA